MRSIELICTNFKDFINEQDLYIYSDNREEEKDPYIIVYNSFNGMRYRHDFPKGKTITESYSEVKEKYDRRIKRLMDLINSDKKVCFVFYSGVAKLPKAGIMYSTEMFYKIFPKRNVDFLILQNDLDIGDEVVYEELSDNIRHISFYNGPYSEDFQGNIYNISLRIKQVSCAVVTNSKPKKFLAQRLNSIYHQNDIITNPTPDFTGMVSFGPYTCLLKGKHNVTVDFELTENYRAFFDICDNFGDILIPKIELPHNKNQFKFDFHLDKCAGNLEVRFYCEPIEKIDENNKFQLFGIQID